MYSALRTGFLPHLESLPLRQAASGALALSVSAAASPLREESRAVARSLSAAMARRAAELYTSAVDDVSGCARCTVQCYYKECTGELVSISSRVPLLLTFFPFSYGCPVCSPTFSPSYNISVSFLPPPPTPSLRSLSLQVISVLHDMSRLPGGLSWDPELLATAITAIAWRLDMASGAALVQVRRPRSEEDGTSRGLVQVRRPRSEEGGTSRGLSLACHCLSSHLPPILSRGTLQLHKEFQPSSPTPNPKPHDASLPSSLQLACLLRSRPHEEALATEVTRCLTAKVHTLTPDDLVLLSEVRGTPCFIPTLSVHSRARSPSPSSLDMVLPNFTHNHV